MKKATLSFCLVIAILIAVAIPIAASLYLANQQSVTQAIEQSRVLASDILRRTEDTVDQVNTGSARIAQLKTPVCSDVMIAEMRDIDIASTYIQIIGRVSHDRLLCSSQGRHGSEGIALGPVDYAGAKGMRVRKNIELPLSPGHKYTFWQRDDYGAIIHPKLLLDVFTDQDVSLSIYSHSLGAPIISRGTFRPEWIDRLGEAREMSFYDGEDVVTIRRSSKFGFTAVAAIPGVYLQAGNRHFALVLVPIGIVIGIGLAILLLYVIRQRTTIKAEIQVALRKHEFTLAYQPIMDLRSGDCIGAEALIRWRRHDGTFLRPDIFIPVAEEKGIIHQITEEVIDIAGRETAQLLKRYPGHHISINLAAADLHTEHTLLLLREMLRRNDLQPSDFYVEATERGFLNMDKANSMVKQIRQMGIHVAIDDFGTGYSSLSYLAYLQLDYLKIDKSFVDAIGTEAPTRHVVAHIIEMAKELNLAMIAEGVETEVQKAYLRNHGVQYAQGWLFGKPMSIDELARLFAERPLRTAELAG